MSQAPNAESDDERNGFTCGTLFTCLCLPGFSKKRPEETGKSQQPAAPEQDRCTEQEPPQVLLNRAASLEKLECSSLYSGSNIVFDFLVEPRVGDDRGSRAIHGYCPSPCFDLPVELIRAGERCGVVASDAPVTSAFVFDGHRDGAALKKMASCLASSVTTGGEVRPTHLVRFLSASGCAVPVRPSVTSFTSGPAKGAAVDESCPRCHTT